MSDFYEIDFLAVETDKSGDAITLRYQIGNDYRIHVVDGGYDETGKRLVDHINKYYGNPTRIDHVVVTHQDRDHTGGLKYVLYNFDIGVLWMLRPWLYADKLLPYFNNRYQSAQNLADRLRKVYPNIADLEDIASALRIPIGVPIQGQQIGAFTVMAPTAQRFLNLVIESEKTPTPHPQYANPFLGLGQATSPFQGLGSFLAQKTKAAVALVRTAWGVENFSNAPISAENDMSLVQYANLCGDRVLLTGDAGVAGLTETIAYAPQVGLALPGITNFQAPHHGGRRNINAPTLDALLGRKLPSIPAQTRFTAIISSAKEDEDHPRKVTLKALIHRGGSVLTTEGQAKWIYRNAPARPNYGPAVPEPYPQEQEV
jgi:hypothetical protein